jgi:hypothetical protein
VLTLVNLNPPVKNFGKEVLITASKMLSVRYDLNKK